jgi:hypothetical protein
VLHNWHSKQLDFLLAYTQTPVERELYMEIPKGAAVIGDQNNNSKYTYVLLKTSTDKKKLVMFGTSI